MARLLTRPSPASAVAAAFAFVAAFVAMPAWADDPTRPPSVDLAGDAAPVETTGPQLQSVFLPASGSAKARAAALINGQRFEVGQHVGNARLVAVNESSATLVGPEGRQTLYLTPGVAKTRAAPVSERRSASQAGHASRHKPAPALSSTGNR